MTAAKQRFQTWLPLGAVLLLLVASLVPVWGLAYVPMQDYPQNLFQAKLTAEVMSGGRVDPLENETYAVHLKATYSAFFVMVALCGSMMPWWAAGKCAVSLYFALTACAAWQLMRFARRRGGPNAGWSALLLFPAAVNPVYYLGFLHFLYAMPLLLMALLQLLESANAGWSGKRAAGQIAWLAVLLIVHPFAIVMYALVAGAWTLLNLRDAPRWRRFGVSAAMAVAVGGAWAAAGWLGRSGSVSAHAVFFQPVLKCAEFAADLVVGLGGVAHVDWVSAACWCAAAGVVSLAALQLGAADNRLVRQMLLAAAVLFAGVCFLPFGTANASYLNVRMAVGVYGLLVLGASLVRLSRRKAVALFLLALLLIGRSSVVQRRISGEIAEIAPVVAAMSPGERLLPLLFNRDADQTDGFFFSLHLNDYFYYQVEKGGASPYLLEAPHEGRAPVFFRQGMEPAAPPAYFPTQFRWEKFGVGYRYYLVRGGNESVWRYMESGASLVVTSGKWRLYERRSAQTAVSAGSGRGG